MCEIHGLHLTPCPTPPLAGLTTVCLPALLLQVITSVFLAEDRRFSVHSLSSKPLLVRETQQVAYACLALSALDLSPGTALVGNS